MLPDRQPLNRPTATQLPLNCCGFEGECAVRSSRTTQPKGCGGLGGRLFRGLQFYRDFRPTDSPNHFAVLPGDQPAWSFRA